MAMEMHKNLRRLLSLKGLSVKEIAQKTQIPSKTLYHWMNGQKPRNIEQVQRLCQVLEVSLDEFFGFSKAEIAERKLIPLQQLLEDVHAGKFEVILRPVKEKL